MRLRSGPSSFCSVLRFEQKFFLVARVRQVIDFISFLIANERAEADTPKRNAYAESVMPLAEIKNVRAGASIWVA